MLMNAFGCRPVGPALIVLTLALGGCATWRSPLSDDQSSVVAQDFVRALSELRDHAPRTTTVQLRPTRTRFGKRLAAELRRTGYGIQMVAKDETGPRLVTYEADSFEDGDGKSVAYRVRVGDVELGREYELRGGTVFPLSALTVEGTTAPARALDNAIFRQRPLGDDAVADRLQTPAGTFEVPNDEPLITVVPDQAEFGAQIRQNVLALGRSNFEEVFVRFDDVQNELLVFGGDSLVLGRANKKTVLEIAGAFNPATDIIGLMGCSHGPTRIENGNELLAIGRANRVKEELIMAQVPASRIFDEGCWAGESKQGLPPRGVLMTLKRRADAAAPVSVTRQRTVAAG